MHKHLKPKDINVCVLTCISASAQLHWMQALLLFACVRLLHAFCIDHLFASSASSATL